MKGDALHLTLRFLGDVTEDQAQRIQSRLAEGYRSREVFTLRLEGVGAFHDLHFLPHEVATQQESHRLVRRQRERLRLPDPVRDVIFAIE